MEQELFEDALKDYIVKKVDSSNPQIVSYELITRPRVKTIHKSGERITKSLVKTPPKNSKGGKEPRPVMTPNGLFPSVREASETLKVHRMRIYQLIAADANKVNKEYYFAE